MSGIGAVRLVAVDLDGTLLDAEERIAIEVIEMIERAHQRGIAVTMVTGRPIPFMRHLAQEAGIKAPMAGCNGAVIFDAEGVYSYQAITLWPLRSLLEKARSLGVTVLYYTLDRSFAMDESAWIISQKGSIREYEIHVPTEEEWYTLPILKINLIFGEFEDRFALFEPHFSALEKQYSLHRYGQRSCEIMAEGINKGRALKSVAGILDIPLEATLAVGDDVNDIPMICNAGVGVAVNNAVQSLRDAADYVSHARNQEGVLDAVARFAGL